MYMDRTASTDSGYSDTLDRKPPPEALERGPKLAPMLSGTPQQQDVKPQMDVKPALAPYKLPAPKVELDLGGKSRRGVASVRE